MICQAQCNHLSLYCSECLLLFRLQKLESSTTSLSEALLDVRNQSADLQAWKEQMDATSHQAASLLSGIEGRVHRLRCCFPQGPYRDTLKHI